MRTGRPPPTTHALTRDPQQGRVPDPAERGRVHRAEHGGRRLGQVRALHTICKPCANPVQTHVKGAAAAMQAAAVAALRGAGCAPTLTQAGTLRRPCGCPAVALRMPYLTALQVCAHAGPGCRHRGGPAPPQVDLVRARQAVTVLAVLKVLSISCDSSASPCDRVQL